MEVIIEGIVPDIGWMIMLGITCLRGEAVFGCCNLYEAACINTGKYCSKAMQEQLPRRPILSGVTLWANDYRLQAASHMGFYFKFSAEL